MLLTKAGKVNGTVSADKMKSVLRFIESKIRDNPYCWVKHETIVRATNIRLRTVKRACDALARLGLIRRKRQKTAAGVTCNHYWINWPRVAEFAVEPTETVLYLPFAGTDQSATEAPTKVPQRHSPKCHEGTDIEAPKEALIEAHHEEGNISPPPPPNDWQAVAAEMASLGVQHRQSAICSAKDAGAPPANILQGIEYFQTNAKRNGWGPGALQSWVKNWDASTRPDEGWPEPDPSAAELQRREDAEELASYVCQARKLDANAIRLAVECFAAGGREWIWPHYNLSRDLPGRSQGEVVIKACAEFLKSENDWIEAKIEALQDHVSSEDIA